MRKEQSTTAGDIQTAISLVTCGLLMWSHSLAVAAGFFVATQACVQIAVLTYRLRAKLLRRGQSDASLARA
jgi:hypothetical protein